MVVSSVPATVFHKGQSDAGEDPVLGVGARHGLILLDSKGREGCGERGGSGEVKRARRRRERGTVECRERRKGVIGQEKRKENEILKKISAEEEVNGRKLRIEMW